MLNDLRSFDPEALHLWLNGKINSRTQNKINGHGKNRYIIALKWYKVLFTDRDGHVRQAVADNPNAKKIE